MTKALMVDDAKLMHRMLGGILEAREVEIAHAYDGVEAIEVAKTFKPDIVFLDIVMPNKDGIETLKELVALDPDVKVLMVSSMGTKDKVLEAIRLGAVGFVQKPYDEDEVLKHFDELV